MDNKIDKKIVFGLINEIISRINRHTFLKEQDMEEWMAVISQYFYENGIYVMYTGCSWCHETSKENVKEYLDQHKDIFEAYRLWRISQR